MADYQAVILVPIRQADMRLQRHMLHLRNAVLPEVAQRDMRDS